MEITDYHQAKSTDRLSTSALGSSACCEECKMVAQYLGQQYMIPYSASQPTFLLRLLCHSDHAFHPTHWRSWLAQTAFRLLPIFISPDAILRARHPKPCRALVTLDPFPPFATHLLAINHAIDLLTMVPTLRVLISRPLDADVVVCDQQLDVTASGLEVMVNRMVLVFADVVANMQQFALISTELLDKTAGKHLIGAPLTWHNLPSVVVAEADVVCDLNATLQGVGDGQKKRGRIEIRRLNEDGSFGVADAGQPGFILGYEHIAVVRLTIRWTRNKSDWERLRRGGCNIRGKFFALWNLGSCGWDGTLFYCDIQLPICSLEMSLARLLGVSRLHACDFIRDIFIPVWIARHVFWECSHFPIHDNLALIACRRSIREQRFASRCRQSAFCRRSISTGQSAMKCIAPSDERRVIQRVYNRTFKMGRHLHVIVVLHVVAHCNGHFPIDDGELSMQGSEQRFVKVNSLEVEVWDLLRFW